MEGRFKVANIKIKKGMSAPKLSKIVLNTGVKDATVDKKNLEEAAAALALISGQKPKVTKARKAIASFKLRKGDAIGIVVTLRGKRMHDFFERLVRVVLPRIRDFHGVSLDSFDNGGNYTLGFRENTVFPEIDLAKIDKARGLEVTIVTTAKNKSDAKELLSRLGMPFKKE